MMGWLLSLLTGPLVGQILKTFEAKDDNQKQIILATLAKTQEDNKLRAALTPQFQWVIYGFAVPCMIHFGLIMIDSSLPGDWHMGIPKVPAPYDTYESQIILSFFILQPVNTVAKGVLSWLHK